MKVRIAICSDQRSVLLLSLHRKKSVGDLRKQGNVSSVCVIVGLSVGNPRDIAAEKVAQTDP